MGTLYGQTQLGAELFGGFHEDFIASDNLVDMFLEPNDLLYSSAIAEETTYASFLPYLCYNPTGPFVSLALTPEILPIIDDDLDCYQYPKRQKTTSYNDLHCSDIMFESLDGYSTRNNSAYQYPPANYLPELVMFPKTENIQVPMVYSSGGAVENVKKSSNGDAGLSAQSVAARQRRRKISQKTQELGKLIPGGNRLNTAEMFEAAFKYVKYLQAQVGILEVMGSIQEKNGTDQHIGGLETLIASPTIQEKLSSEEKCMVPKKFVEILAKDHEIQSNSFISEEIDLLAQSGG
ncbi:hypothetical protein IFM89_018505 [Coptis chinensis]|uniref:BHLH domain-containing protein n=1 Tax=Coptis chinensis TaxID=261450 RepID=A0A835IQX8_9MAGN|nr:hypothetical protein IFM89_018505 [Coptis chinensis]